jgi:predicted SnoaL-like aldol condensation-catalyzing enzyme
VEQVSLRKEHPMIWFPDRRAASFMAAASLILALGSPHAQASDERQTELNKKSVIEFCETAFNEKDFESAKLHFAPEFIDHDPAASGDGTKDIDGFKRFLAFLRNKFPQSHFEIKRVIAQGDYVMVHSHGVREPGTKGRAIVDIFRLDQGKIAEHWDVVQDIPENSSNPRGFF